MNKLKYSLIVLTSLLLVGCSDSPEKIKYNNQQNLNNPEYVGEVNGKKLYLSRVFINNQISISEDKVYFFKDTVITNNYTNYNVFESGVRRIISEVENSKQPISISEPSGKTRKTIIIIDGQKWEAVKLEN